MNEAREQGAKVTLLYVEDEPQTLRIICKIIATTFPDLNLITAENGDAGFRLFNEHHPEIVLTDISMPVMSGIEMARRIRATDSKVHIIAATALADTQVLMEAIKVGISRYVLKPVDLSLLREAIEACLERITLERRIEEQHQFIAKLSRAVQDNPNMVAIANADGVLEYVNAKAAALCGDDPEHAVGQSLQFLFHELPAAKARAVWSSIREDSEWRGEIMKQKENGESYHVDLAISALRDQEGAVTGFVAVMQDVSERRALQKALQESEQQFRTLCDSAPIGIFRTDSTGNNTYCNPRWQEITGLQGDEALGQGWLTLIHPEDRELHAKTWQEAMSEGHRFSLEYRQLPPNQPHRWVRALATRILGCDGDSAGFVGTLEDITELYQARQEMLKTQKLESLGLLAGGIAHDFNNILTAILGNITLAALHASDAADVRLRLSRAEKGVFRAKELTHQLLTFAKGGQPIKKIIKLRSLLAEAADFALHGSNVKCQLEVAEQVSPVHADEGQLMQVMHNLILNAVQAMPEGGTVAVSAANVDGAHHEKLVRVTVADTGAGIPEQHLAKIFDPYFTTKASGNGLGLAACYSIIKKHGGTIGATSIVGQGTTFEVTLPAAEQDCEQVRPSPTVLSRRTGRALVLDDEREVRETAAAMLQALGYQVEEVTTGAEAVALFSQRHRSGKGFDLVILDVTIPGEMGGKDAVMRLREIDRGVKAVVSSGYSNSAVMADFRDYGFDAVLTKPYTLKQMAELLQRLFP